MFGWFRFDRAIQLKEYDVWVIRLLFRYFVLLLHGFIVVLLHLAWNLPLILRGSWG